MVPTFKPFIKRQDMQSVLQCMVTDIIGPASIKDDLVSQFSRFLHHFGGIAVREYYRAILTVFASIGLNPGDKIVISPLAPAVYGDVCRDMGLEMLYADVEPDSGCIDPKEIANFIENKPSLILVHYPLGYVPDLNEIYMYKIPVIEDISHSLGAQFDGQICGSQSVYTIISMEFNGIITSGGGTVVTAISKSALKSLNNIHEEMISEDMILSDLNASLAIIQLNSLEKYLNTRIEIYDVYLQSLLKTHHKTLHNHYNATTVPYSFPVLLETGIQSIIDYSKKHGIEVQLAFKDTLLTNITNDDLKSSNSYSLYIKTVLFPCYPGLKRDDISKICRVLATLPS